MIPRIDKIKRLFVKFMNGQSVRTISAIPIITAILLVTGWTIIAPDNPEDKTSIWGTVVLSTALFFIGSTGFVYVYKKEMPGLTSSKTIKGTWAIFSGILLVVFFWGMAVLGIYYGILGQ